MDEVARPSCQSSLLGRWPIDWKSSIENIMQGLSFKCWLLGHEDWVRCASDRLYLECIECGRQTRGWTIGRINRGYGGVSLVEGPLRSAADPYHPSIKGSSSREREMTHSGDMTIAA
jgi:hypothetical protein